MVVVPVGFAACHETVTKRLFLRRNVRRGGAPASMPRTAGSVKLPLHRHGRAAGVLTSGAGGGRLSCKFSPESKGSQPDMAMSAHLALRLRPEAEAVPELLDRLEAFAEEAALPPGVAHRLALVAEELVANVAMHGAGASFVEVALRREADGLHLDIADDGPAFDPLARGAPDTALGLEDREIGGLGIHFVRKMVRSLDYRRDGACNRLAAVLDAG
jgi:serine/threonine-protein kinase RsbW